MRKRGPKLPREVFSVLGNMPLTRDTRGLDDGDFGLFDPNERRVAIHPTTSQESEWLTYWHEVTHVALFDSGCRNILTREQEETICDSLGTYLSAMMQAGMLKVVSPKL